MIRAWLICGAIAAAIAAAGWIASGLIDHGRQEERQRVEKLDRDASDAARQARERRRACIAAGGLWDTVSGECRGG